MPVSRGTYKRFKAERAKRYQAARTLSSLARSTTVMSMRTPPSSIGQAWVRPRVSGPEKKFIDTTITNLFDNAGAAGNCVPINLCAQGTAVNQRIGNTFKNLSVFLSGQVGGCQTGNGATQGCRIIIFWDTQPRGVNVVAGDMLNTTDVSGQFNPSTLDRFKIVYDKRFATGPLVNGLAVVPFNQNCPPIIPISAYRSLKGYQTVYNGGAAPIANVQTNSLYLLTLGDQPAGGVNLNPSCLIQCRVRYSDA